MGRSVIAIENSLAYLLEYAKPDSYSIGLVLGQTAGSRDYVIHLARTPPLAVKPVEEEGSPENSDAEEEKEVLFRSIQEVNDGWVADHAKHVTRMLPGGVWVLGIFIVGPDDVFADPASVTRIKGILNRLTKTLSANRFLHGNGPSPEKLVLFLDSKTHKYTCKSVEGKSGGAVSPVDWKFQAQPTSWHQLDCQFEVDQLFPVVSESMSKALKAHLLEVLSNMNGCVEDAVCMVEGELREPSELLSAVGKKKKGKQAGKEKEKQQEGKTLTANLIVPWDSGFKDKGLRVTECSAELNFTGALASRVFLHQKATVEEAVKALKQDIVRSLAARLEMHWDSIIEEENGSPEERFSLHEPPRRVLVSLPHCRVTLSDYLFPGEGPSEALISLQELLDLHVSEADVQKDIELQADAPDLYNPEIENAVESDSSETLLPATATPYVTLYACFAFCVFVLVASIAVQYIKDV